MRDLLQDGSHRDFCCLEALQNAQKYAAATQVSIRLHAADRSLGFEVADDGCGFDLATASHGAGLTNMRDRLDALGGTFEIVSNVGRGSQFIGSVPVPAAATP
jgi:signal transduction histidine kinase